MITYDWACQRIVESRNGLPGPDAWLVARRSLSDPTDIAYYLSNAPVDTPLLKLAQVASTRYTVEQCIEEAKGETGLDEEDLILSGCRRVDNWAVIQRLVPSADTIFQHGAPPDRVEHLTLTENEQQIVSAVDGVRDVAAIARDLGLTLFEASRVCYCLAAVGIVRSADPDKVRLRRVFREIAELMCSSTIAWRSSPDDRTCEEDVNRMTLSVPLRLDRGRIEDQSDPRLKTEELVEMYRAFLLAQLDVISRRFGRDNAQQSFELTLRQLAPELQNVAKRYRFDRLLSA